jgi:hypothetical protein
MLVDQLTQQPLPELAPKAAVYALQFVSATNAAELLRRAVPRAEFTLDAADPTRLTAWASPVDQETIQAILQDIDIEGEGVAAKVEVYRLEGITTAAAITPAITLLTNAFPGHDSPWGPPWARSSPGGRLETTRKSDNWSTV